MLQYVKMLGCFDRNDLVAVSVPSQILAKVRAPYVREKLLELCWGQRHEGKLCWVSNSRGKTHNIAVPMELVKVQGSKGPRWDTV